VIGASFRLFIVVNVLQIFVFDAWGIPFAVTTSIFIILIIAYTLKGGVKTIVWTDSLQTTFMLLSLVLSVVLICKQMNFGFGDMITAVKDSTYSKIIVSDWQMKTFLPKHFFGGMFIAIAMTGLDQEMMQKNISCKNIGEAKKNVITFSLVLVLVNFIFLCLGALLYIYITAKNIPLPVRTTDDLFPTIALQHLGTLSALFFIIGLISAAYPSADGALTALTASFCIDFLRFDERTEISEAQKTRWRKITHIGFAVVLLLVIVIFRMVNDEAVIRQLFKVANYTYGPLLGLFFFGILTKRNVRDKFVPVVCLLAPVICYLLDVNSKELFNGYLFGNELLIVNGILTFFGLSVIGKR
jgi:Na+/proline symporter